MHGGRVIAIEAGLAVIVGHHDVDVAIVVQIAESSASAGLLQGERRAAIDRLIAAQPVVQPELIELPQGQRGRKIDRAVGREEVQVAVVVGVKPAGAEARVGHAAGGQPSRAGAILEPADAVVDEQGIAFSDVVREE